MIKRNECFDIREWQRLLDDDVDRKRSERLTAHLDSCDECRQALEDLAGSHQWWTETSHELGSATTAALSNSQGLQEHPSNYATGFLAKVLKPCSLPDTLGLLDQYQVRRMLGCGGMGVVVEAFDPSLHRTVAIKLLHPHLAAMGVARQRFAREARAAAAVMHPNVVAIHAVLADAEHPYLVMTYIPGESLQQRIDRQGPLPLLECLRIATQIAAGLAAAHDQGMVHRDIKPANILLETGTARVWLTDFGLARTLDDATMTSSGFIAGTPQFMSPQQANGDAIDHRSDMFSLGSVMYVMLSGRPPFRAESSIAVLRRIADHTARPLREIRGEIPLWLEAIVSHLHERDVDQRASCAKELSELLNRCAIYLENPSQAKLPERAIVMQKQLREKRRVKTGLRTLSTSQVATSALLLLSLIIIAGLLVTRSSNKHTNAEQTTTASQLATPPVSETAVPITAVPMAMPNDANPANSFNLQTQDLAHIRSRIEQLKRPFFPNISETFDDE